MTTRRARLVLAQVLGLGIVLLVAVSCTSTYTVGGTVSGLSGTVVLEDNGGDDLSVSANGPFTFATGLAQGASYAVSVKTSPSGHLCSVSNGSGTMATANVTNVAVSCTSTYTVGGTVSGLSGTVVLEDNGGDDLSVSANGPFTFATGLAQGASYAVSVKTSPSGHLCSVSNGSGTMATANVTNVAVSCTSTYTVGGTVSGLSGTVVLEDNGGDDLSVSANGPFTFATGLAQGASYAVSVKTSPSGQLCSVSNGSGTMATANVTNVAVSCSNVVTDDFNRPDGNLGPAWTPMADGGLAIASQVVTGTSSAYSGDIRIAENYSSDQSSQIEVTATQLSGGQWIGPAVRAQDGGQDLYAGIYFWNNGNPELMLFKRISGTWTELGSPYATGPLAAGTQLTLSVSGSTLSFAENGTVVITAPDTALSGGAPGIMAYGTAEGDDWVGVGSLGPASTYTVGGTVSGLSGTVVLEDNGGDDLSVSANGPFTFATGLAQNVAYTVSVKTSPSGQLCSVSNGSGTMATANVTNVAVSCSNVVTDDFNRPDGNLGPAWTPMADGGLAIASQVVTGTSSAYSGDIRIAENYSSDQSSQIEVTATQLSGGQWIGPAVRAQDGGQDLYAGIYFWNNGNPELMLFKRISGTWTELGSPYATGPLAAGTQLTLSVSGSTLSFAENGTVVITAPDTALSGGAPGIMAYGTAEGDDWVGVGSLGPASTYTVGGTVSGLSGTVVLEDNGGDDLSVSANGPFTFATGLAQNVAYTVSVKTSPSGQLCSVSNGSGTMATANVTNVAVTCAVQTGTAGFAAQYVSTDASGVQYYTVTSTADGPGPQTLRVLQPTHPVAGVPHNFIYVLPVEAGLATDYGDGLDTLESLDAEDQYNLTVIEPTFGADNPWYADNPDNANIQYETFMTELQSWVVATFSISGTEQNWLIGFSKSGFGAQDLILKHPDLFQLAASWDFPADMSSYDQFGESSIAGYGTDANFQANYRLTPAFVEAHSEPFTAENRIWIGGYDVFQTDIADYDALLTSEGILHTTAPAQLMTHSWDGGWVPEALAALAQDSSQLP